MNIYTYTNNKNGSFVTGVWTGEQMFECVASNILEADSMFAEATHKNPMSLPYVGCEPSKFNLGDWTILK